MRFFFSCISDMQKATCCHHLTTLFSLFFKFPTSSLPFGCKTVPQEALFFSSRQQHVFAARVKMIRIWWRLLVRRTSVAIKKRKMSMCFLLIYLFIYFNESLTHAALRCSRRTTMTRSDRSSWGSSRCSTAPRSRTEGGARRRGAHDRPPPHPWGETQIKVCGEKNNEINNFTSWKLHKKGD